jgi:phosphoglycolate phosphatase-like HAD superfamily hydrolase
MTGNCYVFDIDGTLANGEHRLHHIKKEPKDWDTYFSECPHDEPIPHMIMLARHLRAAGVDVIYVTGRSDSVASQTAKWLSAHGAPAGRLVMRKAGDHQPDDTLKVAMLQGLRTEGFEPIMAFDDRNRVVKAWRENGVPCAQVADGDF